ncbi:hypothetical protein AMBAS45_17135 [Alteromonas macleodii str. 'Balearic Sea AD45']|uniref:hypothetical protein n=1 Tax=Alteromonas macleodii TaxID=28108 RepID=UPI000286F8A7|nr:hypothetical protein [Alteromonas macleodii]AFT96886.1 hypothetical protein AMBAS45_17135 [Alteromonas macleodii str. 'Balearic Sea AD45']
MKLRKIISLEEKKEFDKAIISLNNLIAEEDKAEQKVYYRSFFRRLIERMELRNPYSGLKIEQLFEKFKYLNKEEGAPVISLTAISGRLKNLERTITSLQAQSLAPASINLFISIEPFLVDEGFDLNDPQLKKLHDMGVNVFVVPNIGPYRKQLPIIKYMRDNGYPLETVFITVDDDVIYPSNTIEMLVDNIKATNTVTAYRGREIVLENNRIGPYKNFRVPVDNISPFNLGTGKNGIAYKLSFFPELDELFIGSVLAPTADDVWCKWITGVYCIDTTILEPTAAYDKSKDFQETEPDDKVGLYHVFNAKGRNDVAMEAMEIYFAEKGANLSSILAGIEND